MSVLIQWPTAMNGSPGCQRLRPQGGLTDDAIASRQNGNWTEAVCPGDRERSASSLVADPRPSDPAAVGPSLDR